MFWEQKPELHDNSRKGGKMGNIKGKNFISNKRSNVINNNRADNSCLTDLDPPSICCIKMVRRGWQITETPPARLWEGFVSAPERAKLQQVLSFKLHLCCAPRQSDQNSNTSIKHARAHITMVDTFQRKKQHLNGGSEGWGWKRSTANVTKNGMKREFITRVSHHQKRRSRGVRPSG